MAHVFERVIAGGMTFHGGAIYFSKPDPLALREDLQLIKPTIFCSVPRIYNKMYDGINAKIADLKGMKKKLVETALSVKLDNLKNSCSYTHPLWDRLVFNKIRTEAFGGCVRFMITGSAPMSAEA